MDCQENKYGVIYRNVYWLERTDGLARESLRNLIWLQIITKDKKSEITIYSLIHKEGD